MRFRGDSVSSLNSGERGNYLPPYRDKWQDSLQVYVCFVVEVGLCYCRGGTCLLCRV